MLLMLMTDQAEDCGTSYCECFALVVVVVDDVVVVDYVVVVVVVVHDILD